MSWIYDSDNFILSAPHLAASSATVSDVGTLAHILKVRKSHHKGGEKKDSKLLNHNTFWAADLIGHDAL